MKALFGPKVAAASPKTTYGHRTAMKTVLSLLLGLLGLPATLGLGPTVSFAGDVPTSLGPSPAFSPQRLGHGLGQTRCLVSLPVLLCPLRNRSPERIRLESSDRALDKSPLGGDRSIQLSYRGPGKIVAYGVDP
jgi:hypothetical protein